FAELRDVSQLRLTVVCGNASGQVSGRSLGGSPGARSSLGRLRSTPKAPQFFGFDWPALSQRKYPPFEVNRPGESGDSGNPGAVQPLGSRVGQQQWMARAWPTTVVLNLPTAQALLADVVPTAD